MSSSSVNDINDMFNKRLTRPDKILSRPVNPSASISTPGQNTKFNEVLFRPQVTEPSKLGSEYRGHIVDTKVQDVTFFDHRSVETNPKAGFIKHTPNRLQVEHTREK